MSVAPEHVGRAIAVSTTTLLGARAVHFALNVVAGLAIIRALAPASYGDYVFVLSFATLFGLVSDFGIAKVAVRDISRGDDESVVLGTAIAVRVGLAVIALGLAQATLFAIGARLELHAAVAVSSLAFVVDGLLTVLATFQVRLRMQYEAGVTLVIQAIDSVLILVAVAIRADLVTLVAAPVVSGAIGAFVAVALARRRFAFRPRFDLGRVRALVLESLPIGLTTVIVVLYVKTDAVLLEVLASSRDVGLFGAAYKPIEYAFIALLLPMNVLLPLLSRWAATDRARFSLTFWRGIDLVLALALPVTAVTVIVADDLVALYAPAFASAAIALRLLALALPSMLVSAWLGFALLAAGRQRVTLLYDAVALAANVGMNLILIPVAGFAGAAIAALMTTLFVLAASSLAAGRLLDAGRTSSRAAPLLLANLALCAGVFAARAGGLPWWGASAGGLAIYPALVLATRAVSLPEIRAALPARRTAEAT